MKTKKGRSVGYLWMGRRRTKKGRLAVRKYFFEAKCSLGMYWDEW